METVTVACKLPNGLRMRIFSLQTSQEPVMGGGSREFKIFRETGEEFTIRGWSIEKGSDVNGEIMHGAFLNHGVPKAFWDKWYAQNKDSAFVKEGLIFANDKENSVRAEAKEKKDVRSGLERLDPNKLPKGIKPGSHDAAVAA